MLLSFWQLYAIHSLVFHSFFNKYGNHFLGVLASYLCKAWWINTSYFTPWKAGQDYFALVFYSVEILRAWEMILPGLPRAFAMLCVLKVALHWPQQQQFSMAFTQGHHFSFVRVYFLHGGCVAYTLVLSGSLYRRNIISR
jgi:hypothetical protein